MGRDFGEKTSTWAKQITLGAKSCKRWHIVASSPNNRSATCAAHAHRQHLVLILNDQGRYPSCRCYRERRRPLARIALDVTNTNEPVSPRSRYGMHHSQPALAVAQEDPFVSSPRRHPHRPPWIQVHVPDHDHADRERGPLVTDVAATALVCMSLIAPEPDQP